MVGVDARTKKITTTTIVYFVVAMFVAFSLCLLSSAAALRLPMVMQTSPGKGLKPTFDGTFKEVRN
jgi:hypothetical protein